MMGGQVVGDFEIEARIGEGGMGEVFKGRDLMLEREVAIKSLRPEFAARTDVVERFHTEAVALARLSHPNIAAVYRFFRAGDQYYMAMEYVAGETLAALIARRGALPWQEAVRYGIAALSGLEHAHRANVIHRDIKPANIMLTPDGGLKLMDFGIARILEKARQTRTGHVVGTLEYMSPEQVQGREVDARADLYALAVVLFELVTGRVPFEKRTDFEMMKAQLEEPAPSPRQFNASLPIQLETVLLRALAKSPGERYPNAAAFRAALEALLLEHTGASAMQGGPAPAPLGLVTPEPKVHAGVFAPSSAQAPGVATVPSQTWWKRYPGVVGLLVALLALAALAWWSRRPKEAVPIETNSAAVSAPVPAGTSSPVASGHSEPARPVTVPIVAAPSPDLPSPSEAVPAPTPEPEPAPPPKAKSPPRSARVEAPAAPRTKKPERPAAEQEAPAAPGGWKIRK